MINSLLIFLGKIIALFSFRFKLGGGSTWPGHLILILKKNFLKEILKKNCHLKIILITGTNGKTTSTALIKFILSRVGYEVFSNQEGANLLNGIVSSVIKNVDLFGYIKKQVAVWEVDEFSLPIVLKELTPQAVVILNLFRDQLDRYGEVNTIASRWYEGLKELDKKSTLIINGDDPYLYYLSQLLRSKRVWCFGLEEKEMLLKNLSDDVDFIFCPLCNQSLVYSKISYSHLGIFRCLKCNFYQKNIQRFKNTKINYPLEGVYMKYNTHAVILLLIKLFNLPLPKINESLKKFTSHFGRQEVIKYRGRKLFLILSKNPASFNQSLETAKSITKNKKISFLIILNNRIPDGLDVSWIWDIDFKKIKDNLNKVFVSGDRAYDMALRLKYELFPEEKIIVFENLKQAINETVGSTKVGESIIVLPNYSAMLLTRQLLVGKKFL